MNQAEQVKVVTRKLWPVLKVGIALAFAGWMLTEATVYWGDPTVDREQKSRAVTP